MRILYVEDDRDTSTGLKKLLERQGHSVTVADTAREARMTCANEEFDLWLLDIGLPDLHGGELLKVLRRIADTPAIALTGYSLKEDIEEGKEDGFHGWLVKPVASEQLENAISSIARGHRWVSIVASSPTVS